MPVAMQADVYNDSNRKTIARFKGRVLIVHGDEDPIVPISYAYKAEKLYNDASVIAVHGADHCFVGHLDELARSIKSFFNTAS